jgi:hypothetical protein
MSVCDGIRARMDDLSWEPVDLCVAMKRQGNPVNFATAYQWYIRRREPRASMVPLIAAALGVTPNDLYGVEPASVAAEA